MLLYICTNTIQENAEQQININNFQREKIRIKIFGTNEAPVKHSASGSASLAASHSSPSAASSSVPAANFTADLFFPAEREIYLLMETNLFKNFISTTTYRICANILVMNQLDMNRVIETRLESKKSATYGNEGGASTLKNGSEQDILEEEGENEEGNLDDLDSVSHQARRDTNSVNMHLSGSYITSSPVVTINTRNLTSNTASSP